MGNPARGADFIAKACEQFFVPRGGFRKEFQGHRLAQHQVVGAIDFPHSSPPEYGHDSVPLRQKRSGKKTPFAREAA